MSGELWPDAKLAVVEKVFDSFMGTVQTSAALPLQKPPQLLNRAPTEGVAIIVIGIFSEPLMFLQVPGQVKVFALVGIVTEPFPTIVTSSLGEISLKLAVTVLAAVIVTVQSPLPVQAPLQAVNFESVFSG